MKIYIQSNKYQKLASIVSKYSFERFGHEVEIMNVEENDFLKDKLNHEILRKGKKTIYRNDLQSFTLLRFLAPQLNNYKDKILVIDPDIFALKDPKKIIEDHSNSSDLSCVFYNNIPRSEMMLVDAKRVKWNFKNIVSNLFNFEIDYEDLMNFKFNSDLTINKISECYNSHDKINDDTILLHTTNRITQPWKEGLEINFFKNNLSKFQIFKEHVKKIIGKSYNEEFISKFFLKHPDKDVKNCIKNLFKEAKELNYFSQEDIEKEVANLNISRKIFE